MSVITAARPRATSRRRLAVGVTAMALIVAAFVTRWTTMADISIGSTIGTLKADPRPRADFPAVFGFAPRTDGGTETIELIAAKVRFREDTTDATVDLVLCEPQPRRADGTFLGAGASTQEPSMDTYCTKTTPVRRGMKIRVEDKPGEPYFIATVTPRRPGTFIIDGFETTFRRDAKHLFRQQTVYDDEGTYMSFTAS